MIRYIDQSPVREATVSARKARRRMVVSSWVVVLGGLALACPQDNDILGTGGAGGAGGHGTAGTPSGGSGGQPPATAPACTTEQAQFVVLSAERNVQFNQGSQRVRVLDRGFGVPEGFEAVPASPDGYGWVRLAWMLPPDPDVADASADAPVFSPNGVALLGSHALGELAVAPGDELDMTYRADAFPRNRRLILERDGRLVLFHQASYSEEYELGTFSGLTLALGAALCVTPFRECADIYRHELDVTVPEGGPTVTLAPGASQAIGGYRVLHGSTETVTRRPEYVETMAGAGGQGPNCRTVTSRTEITVLAVDAEE